MIISVHQPNYLPWIGYFRKIAISDAFIFFDDIQFEKGGYTNRVRIRMGDEPNWLTQPVLKKDILNKKIFDVKIDGATDWKSKHLKSFEFNYKKSNFYNEAIEILKSILSFQSDSISDFNINAVEIILNKLKINTKIFRSSALDYGLQSSPSEKLASIVISLGGKVYLSGSGGKKYNDLEVFSRNHICLKYDDWTPPVYNQGHPFSHGLSIIDGIAHLGIDDIKKALFP
jgi:hypothetical protein